VRKYIISFVLLFVLVTVSYAAEKRTVIKEVRPQEFRVAPDFKLKDLYGTEYALNTYREKQPLVLFFWTTWCPYCRRELAQLNNRYLELVNHGFELFAIDIGENLEKVDQAAKNYSLAFKILLDKDTAVSQSYEVLGVPTYVLIDKKGRIVSTDHTFPEAKYKQLISK
jgi:peroxiredoxin